MIVRRILIAVAVEAEREAVLRGLGERADGRRFDVIAVGVGSAAAAAGTTRAIAEKLAKTGHTYELVISAGIGGGFPHVAEIGSIVIAETIVAADLGAETPEGFVSVDRLGFGQSCVIVDADLVVQLVAMIRETGLHAVSGPILTVSTVTGSSASAKELVSRVPGAAAEAMEGYGVAIAAQAYEIPAIEIRAISNSVGPRDRAAWRIPEALFVLSTAITTLKEAI